MVSRVILVHEPPRCAGSKQPAVQYNMII
jgi:hypothetical protein